ncbi:MAG: TadE family protein [Bryobacteraceae bacterium]|jgi:Flp pilus assembly protein TadG
MRTNALCLPTASPAGRPFSAKRRRSRGSELIEFTIVMLPFFALMFIYLDVAWAIFVKSTLQQAVRVGVRYGVTNPIAASGTNTPDGACLTESVKARVQQSSLGLLAGDSGLSKIKVNYYLPPAPNSTDPVTLVSGSSSANAGGNIMVVSVESYSAALLVPIIVGWTADVQKSPLVYTVRSADRIEPTRDPPCAGSSP